VKYLHYIFRNIRRNRLRSSLTIASTAITILLMVILVSYASLNGEIASSTRVYNRLMTMSSQGFAGRMPISRVNEISTMDGVVATSPFLWYGGKFGEEVIPFAQFGVDSQSIFDIYNEFTIAPAQLKAFQEDKAGCVIGRKLADDRGWKVGDSLPLKGDIYPFNLNLTIRGIYDGPTNRNLRICFFHYDYLEEGLKRDFPAQAGNAGIVAIKCKDGDVMTAVSKKIDANYLSSDMPTRTQTEEAFAKMFGEMMREMQTLISGIGVAVVASLMLVAGNAMAMSLRERTSEIAVLKAIGYDRTLVLFLVLAEGMIVSGLGGLLGAFGGKLFFDVVDVARYSGGFLALFYISLTTATVGLCLSLLIGFFSGIVPAMLAARSSVIDGLRKVV
jgi:putative ABC transport system permease protein